jgi:hypothetical protein
LALCANQLQFPESSISRLPKKGSNVLFINKKKHKIES